MIDWCWFEGQILPLSEVRISPEDRGFQLADGVYEVIRLYNGRPFELQAHWARLQRSCAGIQLSLPLSTEHLTTEVLKLAEKSGLRDGLIYLQVTRGVAPRNHLFPAMTKPTLLFYTRPLPALPPIDQVQPWKLLSVIDDRWHRCWIKSIALLPNTLARNAAAAAGADEAAFIYQGNVTEGSLSNIFLVIGQKLYTHPVGEKVLRGVTRDLLLDCAAHLGIETIEKPILIEDAKQAAEVFATTSTREIVWVSKWDDQTIANNARGPVTHQLHAELRQRIHKVMG